MFRVAVLYPRTDDSHFDMDYYLESHMPFVAETLDDALDHYEVDRGIGGTMPGDPPPYAAIGYLFFKDVDALKQMGRNARTIMADVPNFTSVQPAVQVSKVMK